MADSQGKYDDVATIARTLAGAEGVVLIVWNGVRGHGMSVQGPLELQARVPELLRDVANRIEAETRRLAS